MCWIFATMEEANFYIVSVAGCLGYDVLESTASTRLITKKFQLLVV